MSFELQVSSFKGGRESAAAHAVRTLETWNPKLETQRIPSRPVPPAPRILVLGVGNLLMKDDGVGVHAIRELERDPPPGADLADGGTAILHALEWIDGAGRLLVIDAVRAGGEPGTVGVWDGYAMERGDRRGGIHALGVRAAIEWLPEDRRPADFVVVGVEPAELDYGMDLSPAARRALPRAVDAVRRRVAEWRGADESAGRFR